MRDTRYSLPKATRKIGGKLYHYMEVASTKAEAAQREEQAEKRGYLHVRCMPWHRGYAIYVRKS